jgi:hypothetical protein
MDNVNFSYAYACQPIAIGRVCEVESNVRTYVYVRVNAALDMQCYDGQIPIRKLVLKESIPIGQGRLNQASAHTCAHT